MNYNWVYSSLNRNRYIWSVIWARLFSHKSHQTQTLTCVHEHKHVPTFDKYLAECIVNATWWIIRKSRDRILPVRVKMRSWNHLIWFHCFLFSFCFAFFFLSNNVLNATSQSIEKTCCANMPALTVCYKFPSTFKSISFRNKHTLSTSWSMKCNIVGRAQHLLLPNKINPIKFHVARFVRMSVSEVNDWDELLLLIIRTLIVVSSHFYSSPCYLLVKINGHLPKWLSRNFWKKKQIHRAIYHLFGNRSTCMISSQE